MALILTFSGEYDLSLRDALRAQLLEAGRHDQLVLDFSAVTFVDSTVVSEVLRLRSRRNAEGLTRPTLVLPPGSQVERVFRITGTDRAFEVVSDLQAAVLNGPRFDLQNAVRMAAFV